MGCVVTGLRLTEAGDISHIPRDHGQALTSPAFWVLGVQRFGVRVKPYRGGQCFRPKMGGEICDSGFYGSRFGLPDSEIKEFKSQKF